ncbi:MAG: hypothetical protein KDA88_16500 [Planctomycetaceae bacterium]|nr:hypothetical protein [Planctomycetaceae bacterium]
MNFQIRFSGGHRVELGKPELHEDILTRALDRFGRRLLGVRVFLEDVNGPRGGANKQCRCVLHVRNMPDIVIYDQDENVLTLMQRVARRAAFAMSKKSERKQKKALHHRGHREPLQFAG